jgi:hypothetical protein
MSASDFSDVLPPRGDQEVSPVQLPTRGEWILAPQFITPAQIDNEGPGAAVGDVNLPNAGNFTIKTALYPYVDYVVIRLPHRGLTATGAADPTQAAYYRFLINPSSISVTKQTEDSQTLARSGWQFGVWGEGFTTVTLSGKTAGQYFTNGITNYFQKYTYSYRNLQQLMLVFGNNGYFYEGEVQGSPSVIAQQAFSRRRIKMHQDVELMVGNFIWSGMFQSLTVSQDADNPFLATFELQFMAWKERYRASSPYQNSIANNIQRGHSYGVYLQDTNGMATSTAAQTQALNQPSSTMGTEILNYVGGAGSGTQNA